MSAENFLPVFVFIDESGNFDFSAQGTIHFVLSAYVTSTPTRCSQELATLTYEFLARGIADQIPFHASQNSSGTRKRVHSSLCRLNDGCFAYSVVVRKSDFDMNRRTPEALYLGIGAALVERVCAQITDDFRPIVLLFDSALPARHRAAFTQAIKKSFKTLNRRFVVAIRPVSQDLNGQTADFYAWAVFREFERQDKRWTSNLKENHQIEFIRLK